MTFEGKAKWLSVQESVNQILHQVDSLRRYIYFLATKVICSLSSLNLYVYQKNSNHLRSRWRAITALDHSILGLENKSGRIFFRSTSFLYKILPTNLGACKPTFYIFCTSHLRWKSAMSHGFYHTDLGQNAIQ